MSLGKSQKGNKWKGVYDNVRRFKPEWQRTFPWVKKALDGSENAYCNTCRINTQPRLSSLKKHQETAKHAKLTMTVASNRRTPGSERDDDIVKTIEIQLAVSITCHSAVLTVDHLRELIVRHGSGSKLAKMRLHRTKCTSIITDVISQAFYEELCQDMNGQKFCILLDDSTDIACKKLLFLAVRYYSKSKKCIVTALLGLIDVINTTGKDLFAALKEYLQNLNLKLEDCIGYASDGAANMVGQNSSVWSILVMEAPNCIQMKCICHSLALCIKHAFKLMPSQLGFLLKNIPKWFFKSTLRRGTYKKIFQLLSSETESSTLPSPFQRYSQTNWLVRSKVIFNILTNWNELKSYFIVAEQEGEAGVRYKAGCTSTILKDPINYLYFHFLCLLLRNSIKLMLISKQQI